LAEDFSHRLLENNVRRGTKFSESGALLKGKLFDDNGNRMGPTFSSKNGVRYRFYVSTALRGRKQKAGSVIRISAPEIENLVEAEVRKKLNSDETAIEDVFGRIRHATVSAGKIQIIMEGARNNKRPIEIPWAAPTPKGHEHIPLASSDTNDSKLLKAIVRAQHWLNQLSNGQSSSVEDLATAAGYNPKVIRQGLRLAFLAPDVAAAALYGQTQIRLKQIPKSLPLSWREQHRSIN
jgi:site-specific DNA recombinase